MQRNDDKIFVDLGEKNNAATNVEIILKIFFETKNLFLQNWFAAQMYQSLEMPQKWFSKRNVYF